LKAAWELMEIFYVDKQSQAWLPERLVDWLAVIISICFCIDFIDG
jgi:nuclear pore complex protein Nup85